MAKAVGAEAADEVAEPEAAGWAKVALQMITQAVTTMQLAMNTAMTGVGPTLFGLDWQDGLNTSRRKSPTRH